MSTEAPILAQPRDKAARWATLALLAVGLAIICLTVGDYGVSWDEGVQRRLGEGVLQYLLSGFSIRNWDRWPHLRHYGPGFEVLCAAISRIVPANAYTVRHLASAIAALLTIPALVRIGGVLGSRWIGVLGGVALFMMPRFYGHAFINSKDIPFVCCFAWVMAFVMEHFTSTTWNWRRPLLLGVAMGLMCTVRPGGAIVVAIPIAALFVYAACFSSESLPRPWRRNFLLEMLVAGIVGWVVMILPWPFAHNNPLINPIKAMLTATHFPYQFPMLFEGRIVVSDNLPRIYLAKYLLITTPPALLIGALLGLVISIREQLRDPRSARSRAIFALQAWLLLPVLLFTIARPPTYDGIRHWLFLLPALVMFHAIAAWWVISLARTQRARGVILAIVLLLTLSPAVALVRLHPYQMTYFNGLVGGLAGADGRYETDYWLTSFRECMQWINQQAAMEPDRRFKVLLATPPNTIETVRSFMAENIDVSAMRGELGDEVPPDVDYAILSTRLGGTPFPNSPIVHSVGRDGAVFGVVSVPATRPAQSPQ